MSLQEPAASTRPVASYDPPTRATFMKRVYAHLLAGIGGFLALEWLLFVTPVGDESLAWAIADFVLGTSWLLILGGFMIVSWIANSMVFKVRSTSGQYGAYALLVAANALLFATPLVIARIEAANRSGMGENDIIQTAAYLSLFAFAALSVIAIRTGKDFSFLRGILMWGGVLALAAIVGAVIFGATLGTWFSVAMIGFAGAAILYDTQKIYRSYPPQLVVPAAMSLFASLALLFWYVLRLLSRR